MIHAAIVFFIVVVLLALRYVSVRSETLIEGVFRIRLRGQNYFDFACRSCFENNIISSRLGVDGHGHLPSAFELSYACYEEIPKTARCVGGFKPQKGDSIKITVWRNVFGSIIAYKFEQTNFAEEFADKQLKKYEEEFDAHINAWEGIQAEERGVTIEEYRAAKEEERIQHAVQTLEMTREEVIAHGWHKAARFMLDCEVEARRLSKESGLVVTAQEVMRRYSERLNSPTLLADIPNHINRGNHIKGECLLFCYENLEEYIGSGTLVNEWARAHLKDCEFCYGYLGEKRKMYQSPAGPACLSDNELLLVRATGMLSAERQSHKRKCDRCRLHFNRQKDLHMKSPSGPECLTRGDLREMQTNGKIPQACRMHIQSCARCSRDSAMQLQEYAYCVAPFPNIRLGSLQKSNRTA